MTNFQLVNIDPINGIIRTSPMVRLLVTTCSSPKSNSRKESILLTPFLGLFCNFIKFVTMAIILIQYYQFDPTSTHIFVDNRKTAPQW